MLRPSRSTIRAANGCDVRVERRSTGQAVYVANGPAVKPPTVRAIREDLEKIAGEVKRLTVSRRDPERFHVDRGEIVFKLEELLERLR
ncbi:hypothetical protein SAMN05216548_10532 [Faunimonas pinastri]|uniref:Uncharacterized protein n=1 Tax=Faunimonas pinastri TaxID=1855383 RepID=A0A1H9GGK1_9HYPH|nr:hypothetical protein [Faunimonas pinastri]SEQ49187.1 hypothetical protein SAMN05216548_10532 [Faunimonas pinastri]